MRWVKLLTSLRRNPIFRHASPGAKLLFYTAIEIAGDLEQDGALATRIGALNVAQIADEVNLTTPQTQKALDELVKLELLVVRLDGAYVVSQFSDKTGVAAPADSSTGRTRAFRERKRNGSGTSHETSHERSRDAVDIEEEKEIPPTSAEVSPPARVRPTVGQVEFDGPDEAVVQDLLAAEASENKSGTIATVKVQRIRSELRKLLDEHGADVWHHGCSEAIKKPAGLAYAKAVMKRTATAVAGGKVVHMQPRAAAGKKFVAERSSTSIAAAIEGRK